MCGINLTFTNDPDVMLNMNLAMSSRGTRMHIDCYPLSNGKSLSLGHVRLPIQGIGPEHDQPVETDRYIYMFVGEFLNFRDIDPDAQSDLPVFINMYEKHGYSAFDMFDGFWHMVIIDKYKRICFAYTDYLSKKPLYVRIEKGKVVGLSSEIRPLKNLGPVELNRLYISNVMKWGYCPDTQTPYKEIVQINPGTRLAFDMEGNIYGWGRYSQSISQRDDYDFLYAKMLLAVSNRCVSDIPIAVLLSGGLDSTLIAMLAMTKFASRSDRLTLFHVENDESEYLPFIPLTPNTDLVKVDLEDIPYEEAIRANQTPVDLGSVLPQFALGRAVSAHGINVALSGDGADELFGGYRRSMEFDSQFSDIFYELPFYHLPRLDRLMMASTVELRCPFLSKPIIETAMVIPYEKRMSKQALKEIAAGAVPGEILFRPKKPLRLGEMDKDPIAFRKKAMETFFKVEGIHP